MSLGATWRDTLLAHWQRREPSLLSRTLQPLAAVYAALAAADRAAYTHNWRTRHHAPRPLIVVGNLIAGGAGKTPTVMALVSLLRELGHHPGVISRGYGRRERGVQIVRADSSAAAVGDEPLLIHLRTKAPVAVAERRIDAASALSAAEPAIDLLIADDGLQHHALARDVQVIVFDGRGAGNGLLLPAGPLREPMPKALPAASLVLYSEGIASTPLPGYAATRRLAGLVPLADWWRGEPGSMTVLRELRGRALLACAATARPARFFEMLRGEGLTLRELPLPDHDPYYQLPWPADTPDVLVTEKDAVKLQPERTGSTRVWVAPLDLALPSAFASALERLLPRALPGQR